MKELQEEVVIERGDRFELQLKELWHYRELFYFFTWRDVKVKYKQTALGVLWVVIQPILMVLIFTLFFGRTLKFDSGALPYPVFVFSGLLLWNFFSSSINAAGNSMITNSTVIKKIYFPRVIIPVSSILVSCIDFIIAFIVFIGTMIYYRVEVDFLQLIIFWPMAIVFMLMGTLGISCWLAALMVKYRDFRHVIPFGLQLALFISPVIYPTAVSGLKWVNYLLALNPMYCAINFFRTPFYGQAMDTVSLAISTVSVLFFLALGIYYFKKTEAYFADIS
jgi:lipopolysaccharide transport system permease protein